MLSVALESCPFCSKPITREYGTFRCKNCAKSSEDLIDIERKTRAAEIRRAARMARAEKPASPSRSQRLRILALAVERHSARKRAVPVRKAKRA